MQEEEQNGEGKEREEVEREEVEGERVDRLGLFMFVDGDVLLHV